MIFKGKNSKSAGRVLEYICRPQKAEIISVNALNPMEDFAMQMRQTAQLWGKENGRQVYSWKMSPKENLSPQACHELACEVAQKLFGERYEYVIAVHTDSGHVHAHIVTNATSYIDGGKARFLDAQYVALNREANEIAKARGLHSMTYPTQKKRRNLTAAERQMKKRLGDEAFAKVNFKENIRQAIDKVRHSSKDFEDFINKLSEHEVYLHRITQKTITFRDKQGRRVRGNKLGDNYTLETLKRNLTKSRGRTR